ncbi:hypothetical protein F1C58_09815 [Glaciihabitans sp. INWT7]|uniref:hypothetical protein n=1 Tax=Glaciihabitans sp. INWT7 TaxID=2596912 RepID=UPI00162501D6|nr:hypothetical protein [Glaciihabitans sp. INWT7]QNE47165.1 hypothetical protein F1C58_09815 [Glaciihabitans sp. INWT7]
MQMGTRWAVGAEAPSRLPQLVVDAVKAIEVDLEGVDTSLLRWTLTWLEGNPVVELDDGTVIRYSGGEVFIVASTD